MGSSQVKITRKLDLCNTAEVSGLRVVAVNANYSISHLESGTTFIASIGAAEKINLFLPNLRTAANVATNTGIWFNFIKTNVGPVHIVAPANYIRTELGINVSHGFQSINVNVAPYAFLSVCGAHSWYYVNSPNIANVRSFAQA